MPSLGSGLSLGTLNKISGYDYDVSAYIQTAGISNATARSQINTFALGLKSLGLWNTSVCWMLKSSLNAGTGAVAYSFGGLGSYNGSLVNSPTWGSTGISFTSTNQQITLPDDPNLYNARSGFAVFNPSSSIGNQRLIEFNDGFSQAGWYYLFRFYGGDAGERGVAILATRSGGASGINQGASTSVGLLNSFKTAGFSMDNTSDTLYSNGAPLSSRTGLTALNATTPRNDRKLFGNTSSMLGTFGFISTTKLTNSQMASLHSLYVSTFANNRDLDADAYIVRAGVTDSTAQTQINDFVIGAKSLGVWDNMVCWPLRSAQNAETGAIAYSLGGAGNFNGTMVNSPTRGTDGLIFQASANTHITTALDLTNLRKFTALVVASQTSSPNLDVLMAGWGSATNTNYFIMRKGSVNAVNFLIRSGGTARQFNTAGITTGAFNMHGWGTQGASTIATRDGVAGNSVAFVPDETGSTPLTIGILNPPSNAPYNGIMASAMFFKENELTTAQQLALYNLYKTTLGTGLGLP
jgi:hypothetical protein